jgi:hypothetical protein
LADIKDIISQDRHALVESLLDASDGSAH